MFINPIVKKDLQVSARSMRLAWSVFAYEAILTIAFLLALVVIQADSDFIYSSSNIYNQLVYLFPVIAISQVCIIALITPIITASSISGEKERQTFDVMLTTAMSPFSIVVGKVTSAVMRIMFYVVGSLPILALSFVVGGMKWVVLLQYLLAVLLLAIFSGSIGIFCSSLTDNQIIAFILSIVLSGIMYIGFEYLAVIPLLSEVDLLIRSLGINHHYSSISRGVIDTRDVIYYLSAIGLFLLLTKLCLESRNWKK